LVAADALVAIDSLFIADGDKLSTNIFRPTIFLLFYNLATLKIETCYMLRFN